MKDQGLKKDRVVKMLFEGGIKLEGELETYLKHKGVLLILTFKNCLIKDRKGRVLYHPSWGPFDLAVGSSVVSVFSGPADSQAYKLQEDFEPSKVPQRTAGKKQKKAFSLYKKISGLKELSPNQLKKLIEELEQQDDPWLMVLELLNFVKNKKSLKKQILKSLNFVETKKIQNKKVFKLGKEFYQINSTHSV